MNCRRVKRRGFTLIEMVVTVAIIGIITALAVSGFRRASVKKNLGEDMANVVSKIRYARTLATLVAGHIGDPTFANCTVINGGGVFFGGQDVAVTVDPNNETVVVPVQIIATGVGTIGTICDTINLAGSQLDGAGGITADLLTGSGGVQSIAFAANGRAYDPNAPPGNPLNWHIDIAASSGEAGVDIAGIRVLPSGIICRHSDPATIGCDQSIF